MRFVNWLKTTPLWLMMPAIGVAAVAWAASLAYVPLQFDPSLYQVETAQASELKHVDAEEIEAEHAEEDAEEDAEVVAATLPARAVIATGQLADGAWTGYASCGQGNPDDWKPYYVAVTIQVSDGRVTGITDVAGTSEGGGATLNWDAAENQAYLTWAEYGKAGQAGVRSQIEAQLAAAGSVGSIDTVSGATYSSVALYNAYADAVAKAAAAAGAQAEQAAAIMTQPEDGEEAQKLQIEQHDDKLADGKLADGEWTAYAACGIDNPDEWKPYYIGVTVTVENGRVASIDDVFGTSLGEEDAEELNWDEAENQAYLDWANAGRTRGGVYYPGVSEQISEALQEGASPTSIDTVSGATYSATSIFEAYYAALVKSAKAAGYDLDVPQMTDSGSDDEVGDGETSEEAFDGETSEEAFDGETDGSPAQPDDSQPSADPQVLVDGTYTGHAFCEDLDSPTAYSPYYIMVAIQVSGGKVAAVTDVSADADGIIDPDYRYDSKENLSYLNRAINGFGLKTKGMLAKIQEKLDADEVVEGLDTVSGATWSSKSILEAYDNAVEQARP